MPESEELRSAIDPAYHRLGNLCGDDAPLVAVRSSAADEDGPSASFAGQHHTSLGIKGMEALVAAVQRCWASARSPHAAAYRAQRGLPPARRTSPVLVQALIPAAASAIAFTANPVTRRHEVVIEATLGLGDALASGSVTPDRYRVDPRRVSIIARQIAEKSVMTTVTREGIQVAVVPVELRSAPALSDHQARAIARSALRLEEDLGVPVDVECALADASLWILQCRPITAVPVTHGLA